MFIDMLKLNFKNNYLLKFGLIFGISVNSVFLVTGYSNKCEYVPHINDGYHRVVRTEDGRIQVDYRCSYGLKGFGSTSLICNKDGIWEQIFMPWCGIDISKNKYMTTYDFKEKSYYNKVWMYYATDGDMNSCYLQYSEKYLEVGLNDAYSVQSVQVRYQTNTDFEKRGRIIIETKGFRADEEAYPLCLNGQWWISWDPVGYNNRIYERTCDFEVENVFYIRLFIYHKDKEEVKLNICEVEIYGPPTKEYPVEYCRTITHAQNARFVVRGRCFYLFLQEMSQKASNDFCQIHGLKLATIESNYTSDLVGVNIKSIRYPEYQNKFYWVNKDSYYPHCKIIYPMGLRRLPDEDLEEACKNNKAGALCESNNLFCGPPGVRFNQTTECYGSQNLIDVGANITVQCTMGTKLKSGNLWRKCQEGGQWTPAPICN